MKLVYVTPFLRVPPDFGLGIRNYHLIRHLAGRHTLHVVTYGDDDTGQTDAWLSGIGCQVTRLPVSVPWPHRASRLERLRSAMHYPPTPFRRFDPAALAAALHDLDERFGFDAILLDTQLTGQVLVQATFTKPTVVMLADLFEAQHRRQLASASIRPHLAVQVSEALLTTIWERRVLAHARNITTVSSTEYSCLRRRYPHANVELVPNGTDVLAIHPTAGLPNTPTLLFVGGFDYEPNTDAFFYFVRRVLPLVRATHPTTHFLVVGRNPSSEMTAVARSEPNIEITGLVSDVLPYYARATVAVVPLRFGSGTKLKTLEAFAAGVPVVSTSVGVEGIDAHDEEHVLVADDAATFARLVCLLLEQPAVGLRIAGEARHLVEARYDWDAIARQFESYVECVVCADAEGRQCLGVEP